MGHGPAASGRQGVLPPEYPKAAAPQEDQGHDSQRIDQIEHRKAKGSAGGRPPAFDPVLYRQRNTIERSFSRLKQWRGLAARYDKYAVTYLGGVLLGTLILTHRAIR